MLNRLPPWFRQDIPDEKILSLTRFFSDAGVNTVCRQAKCPNISHCFRNNEAAFMILGSVCTRNCGFCNVSKLEILPRSARQDEGSQIGKNTPTPHLTVDREEPFRIKEVVRRLGLKFVVITSVARDDIPDGGSGIFAKVIELIHEIDKDIKVEVLIPDFQGEASSLKRVLGVLPFVVGHNIETVKRLYGNLRPQADYRRSLGVLKKIKELKPEITTKSSLMLGLGESRCEVIETLQDLRKSGCDCLTLGQYLAPSQNHYPVKEFLSIEQFNEYRDIAVDIGFKAVMAGPKVRSSYDAEKMQAEKMQAEKMQKEPLLCMT